MKGTRTVKGMIATGAAAATMIAAMPADTLAQQAPQNQKPVTIRVETSENLSPVLKKMEAEIGQAAADFWIAKLNEYKVRIDRTLSPDDLDALNRLRVRWSVIVADKVDIEETEDARTIDTRKQGKKGTISLSMKMKGEGADGMEFLDIYQSSKGISGRYRGDFDALGSSVIGDVSGFVSMLVDRANTFVNANRDELSKSEDGRKLLAEIGKGEELASELRSEETQAMLQMVYSLALEPIIMLYDGTDLRVFFDQAGPLSSAVTGLKLPESSVLKQNAPNPASGQTTIAYSLTEPSSRTLLRIFDAKGEIVETLQEGARPAGEHVATLDASKLRPGTYLYHLTIQTSKGEQVFSRTMQVVR